MKNLKKFNEFFDTEEFKIEHDIEILSNTLNPKKILKTFDKQEPYMSIINNLYYKYPFFIQVLNPSPYSFLSKGRDDTYFFNFKNEQCKLTIGINRISNNEYNFSITYIPVEVINWKKNWITTYTELLDIHYDNAVSQIFQNINLNQIYNKIDKVLIPIMNEFGFSTLLKLKQSDFDLRKN